MLESELDEGAFSSLHAITAVGVHQALGDAAGRAAAASAGCDHLAVDSFWNLLHGISLPVPVCGGLSAFSHSQDLEGKDGAEVPLLCLAGSSRQDTHGGQFGIAWMAS